MTDLEHSERGATLSPHSSSREIISACRKNPRFKNNRPRCQGISSKPWCKSKNFCGLESRAMMR